MKYIKKYESFKFKYIIDDIFKNTPYYLNKKGLCKDDSEIYLFVPPNTDIIKLKEIVDDIVRDIKRYHPIIIDEYVEIHFF